jgi:hypothetical protein
VDAVQFITSVLNAIAAVSTAKTGWVDARIVEEARLATDGPIVRGMRDNVATMFSDKPTALAAFHRTPKKPCQPLSVEARAAATARARATRIARGTESKKKRAEDRRNVTGVTITPVTNPSASSPSGAGSSAATSSGASSPAQGASGAAAGSASGGTAPAATTSGVPLVPAAVGHHLGDR